MQASGYVPKRDVRMNEKLKITQEWLNEKGACSEAMVRASVELNGGLSVAAIIARLDRPDWILWLLARTGTSKRQIVKLACVAARRALRFFPKDDDRPEKAI